MQLKVITPFSRAVANARRMYSSLRVLESTVQTEWIIVYEHAVEAELLAWHQEVANDRHLHVRLLKGSTATSYYGNSYRNQGLDSLGADPHAWVYFLDDDNILHPQFPDLLMLLGEEVEVAFFAQVWSDHQVRLMPSNISVGNVDTAMFLARASVITRYRWDVEQYTADGPCNLVDLYGFAVEEYPGKQSTAIRYENVVHEETGLPVAGKTVPGWGFQTGFSTSKDPNACCSVTVGGSLTAKIHVHWDYKNMIKDALGREAPEHERAHEEYWKTAWNTMRMLVNPLEGFYCPCECAKIVSDKAQAISDKYLSQGNRQNPQMDLDTYASQLVGTGQNRTERRLRAKRKKDLENRVTAATKAEANAESRIAKLDKKYMKKNCQRCPDPPPQRKPASKGKR